MRWSSNARTARPLARCASAPRSGLRDEAGKESSYTIVGPDEADPGKGRISFESPLGKSLMKKGIGDVVTVRRPAGEVEVTVLTIEYD